MSNKNRLLLLEVSSMGIETEVNMGLKYKLDLEGKENEGAKSFGY